MDRDSNEASRIAEIRRRAAAMTPAAVAAVLDRVRKADEHQANEWATRGTRTSPHAILSMWDDLGADYYAAQIAQGHDPFVEPE